MSNFFIRCFLLLGKSLFFLLDLKCKYFLFTNLTLHIVFKLNIICLNVSCGNFWILGDSIYFLPLLQAISLFYFSVFKKTSSVFWRRNFCMTVWILKYSYVYKYRGMEHEKRKTWTWKTKSEQDTLFSKVLCTLQCLITSE